MARTEELSATYSVYIAARSISIAVRSGLVGQLQLRQAHGQGETVALFARAPHLGLPISEMVGLARSGGQNAGLRVVFD